MKMYTCQYRTPDGKLETRVSPFVKHDGEAFRWLRQQKPEVMRQILTLTIKPYQRGDPK